ncbi:MAG: M24 family metallopeptidase [Rhodothermales bacterium]
MQAHAIDGWLLFDFRGSNPVFAHVLGGPQATSRRTLIWIPVQGEARILVSSLDKQLFRDAGYPLLIYNGWSDMQALLRDLLKGARTVAMEYSPGGEIPMSSFVDGGTLELVRSMGPAIVSSADLFQAAATAWSKKSVDSHMRACRLVNMVKDEAFAYIGDQLRSGKPLTEYDVQQFIRRGFDAHGLYIDHGPIVAVNAHSGDPHYEPSATEHAPIRKGDWVLIDLWAKESEPHAVYCDITWTGYAGATVPAKHLEVYTIVNAARDAVVERLQADWKAGNALQGWQLDDVARKVITDAGYGAYFTHRTGHSMGVSPTPHALGMNLDNLETHDTRAVLPGIGFSVEPGIYMPEFGVRSEIDVYIDPEHGPTVTTAMQWEPVRILD